jgi:hypothetical protein
MSVISNLWGQLVQRRLWPVAVLLIAALAAVPLTLAKQPETSPAPDPVPPAGDSSAELATDPIVALASAGDRAKRRKVLGKAKNPFAKPVQIGGSGQDGPQPAPSARTPESGGGSAPDKLADTINIGGGGGTGAPSPTLPSLGAPPSSGIPAPPSGTPERPDPERHSLAVRFGDSSSDSLERMNVKRLEALPVGEEPLVVYLGVADGGRSAVFMVDSSVRPDGDGACMPDPNTCETIHLREGETEFFDILGEDGEPVAQYQLDLVEIHAGKKSSPARTASASKAVRRVLCARAARPGALHYRLDAESGTLRLPQDEALRATVGRTAEVGLPLP